MRLSNLAGVLALTAHNFISYGSAQTFSYYTEPNTNLKFYLYDSGIVPSTLPGGGNVGGYKFGYLVPASNPGHEYIGIMGAGWAGLSHGGPMTNSLLLMAWPNGQKIVSSFRYATGYTVPDIYTGNATATTLYSSVSSTDFVWIFRCQWCFAWNQGGAEGTSDGSVLGWAQNKGLPKDSTNPNSDIGMLQHNNGQGIYGYTAANAVWAGYNAWISAHGTGTTQPVGGNKPQPTATHTSPLSQPANVTGKRTPTWKYDYIIVGGGAGGITLSDKLSETGKRVLLIEKGPPSSGRWGGTRRPDWLAGTNLTRFDVPSLDNEIWVDANGIACSDVDQMASCVLGGGTAINAGLWWNAPEEDWNENFPAGWKASDMAAAQKRVFERIPGTYHPSLDGKLYLPQGYNIIGGGLRDSGWANITANDSPNTKNHSFSHAPFMYSHGERGGPMATYLVSAHSRPNFELCMKTAVRRVIRNGPHMTGVEVEAFLDGGYTGVVHLSSAGRVILSSGTFNSPKILYRSGIGPIDQLNVVKASAKDGSTMIDSSQWIELPVGQNLVEQANTDMVVSHPDVQFYDFYGAYDNPIPADRDSYLNSRIGMLAQSAPNIGPIFWDQVKGADGRTRQMQWTARVEGSLGAPSGKTITLSMYLGRGVTSRGAISITPNLDITVSQQPFFHTQDDVDALVQGIENVRQALSTVPNLTWIHPAANQTSADYAKAYPVTAAGRTSNHWMGTNKMGDGPSSNGNAVVDINTRVYGTHNLFIVDASIFPGQVTTNPSALVVTAAERAAERILAEAPVDQQCGGLSWTGPLNCESGAKCRHKHHYYSHCVKV